MAPSEPRRSSWLLESALFCYARQTFEWVDVFKQVTSIVSLVSRACTFQGTILWWWSSLAGNSASACADTNCECLSTDVSSLVELSSALLLKSDRHEYKHCTRHHKSSRCSVSLIRKVHSQLKSIWNCCWNVAEFSSAIHLNLLQTNFCPYNTVLSFHLAPSGRSQRHWPRPRHMQKPPCCRNLCGIILCRIQLSTHKKALIF